MVLILDLDLFIPSALFDLGSSFIFSSLLFAPLTALRALLLEFHVDIIHFDLALYRSLSELIDHHYCPAHT